MVHIFLPELNPPPGPPEHRFRELFNAARVLLREGTKDENVIVPTLAVAYEIDRGVEGWILEKEQILSGEQGKAPLVMGRDGRMHPDISQSVRLVNVVDEVLVMKQFPVSVEILRGGFPFPKLSAPIEGVLIQAFPYKRLVKPEEVANLYEEALKIEGISCGEGEGGVFEHEFIGDHLRFTIRQRSLSSRPLTPPPTSGFPPSGLVGDFLKLVMDRFSDRLITRKRGPDPAAEIVIPACVAFFLRVSGEMKEDRKEPHRLINEHVVNKGQYPEIGVSESESNKLWRCVINVVHPQIARVMPQVAQAQLYEQVS